MPPTVRAADQLTHPSRLAVLTRAVAPCHAVIRLLRMCWPVGRRLLVLLRRRSRLCWLALRAGLGPAEPPRSSGWPVPEGMDSQALETLYAAQTTTTRQKYLLDDRRTRAGCLDRSRARRSSLSATLDLYPSRDPPEWLRQAPVSRMRSTTAGALRNSPHRPTMWSICRASS